ncbi:MAG: sporulation protein YqfD, partial [Symbiobacteriaceae bacterium]
RVLARTWYSEYLEIPLEEIVTTRTGRVLRRTYLRIGPWLLPVYWQRGHLSRYEVERRRLLALPGWRDRPPTVELLRETRHEVQVVRRPVDAGQARHRAEQRVIARVMRQLPPGSRVEAVESRIVQRGAGFIGVRATIQVIEDIAVQRPLRLPNG